MGHADHFPHRGVQIRCRFIRLELLAFNVVLACDGKSHVSRPDARPCLVCTVYLPSPRAERIISL
jgi:hypothetical protein